MFWQTAKQESGISTDRSIFTWDQLDQSWQTIQLQQQLLIVITCVTCHNNVSTFNKHNITNRSFHYHHNMMLIAEMIELYYHATSILQFEQEALITLRRQRGHCRNIKGEPQIFGRLPSPRPRPLFLWVWFYAGPWQTRCMPNLKSLAPAVADIGEPQNLRSYPSPRPPPLFPLGVILWWALANRSCVPNLK